MTHYSTTINIKSSDLTRWLNENHQNLHIPASGGDNGPDFGFPELPDGGATVVETEHKELTMSKHKNGHTEAVQDIRHLPEDIKRKRVRDMLERIGCFVTPAAVGERRLPVVILHRIGVAA